MSTLPSQKYTNNIRTVSGTVTLYADDVVLNCNTSSQATSITLFDIPADYWMTTYKLYVVDYSGNAGTNNITINAPTGFTINGASSLTISSNNGMAIIRIANNTNYIASLSSTGAGTITGGSNVGSGSGLSFKDVSGATMRFRSLLAGTGISITNNTNDITITSSAVASYLYAPKLLQTAGTYFAAAAAGTRSVVSGDTVTTFDSKVESGITGFDVTTGVWTVATTGYYSVSAKITTRLNANDVDSNVDGVGAGWMTSATFELGQGYVAIAVIIRRNMGGGVFKTYVVCSDKQIVSGQISDVNVETSAVEFPFQSGDLVSVKVLNKTDHAIVGIASSSTLPDCYIDFAVKQ